MKRHTENIADSLLEGKEASRVALSFLKRDYSYGSLQSAATKIANYLIEKGGEKGDRAVIIAENSYFWVAAYLGVMRAGLICVPLPNDTSPCDLADILSQTEGRFVFVQASTVRSRAHQLRGLHVIVDRDLADILDCVSVTSLSALEAQSHIEPRICPTVARNDLAALMFTSGSTGRPRGVMVSHANIAANTESIIEYLELTPQDRVMTILPFHYCFGASLLHTHLRVGGSLVIDSRFLYPEVVLNRIINEQCTGMAGVPSHYQILLRKSGLCKRQFPHLRYVQQAGGHLAPTFVRELHAALPRARIFLMYGQTEATARLAFLPPELLEKKAGSIGKSIPGVKLRLLNPYGEEVPVGEYGEIVAEGPNITQGYWRDPEGTARNFRDGKLYTGDIARMDDEGYLYIGDRAKSFLKCGGRRISTRQLEDWILELDDLQEAAVIAVPDDVLGEAVSAFVVPRDGRAADLEDGLRQHCRSRMPHEFLPKFVTVMQALPKNSTGKVSKEALKAMGTSGVPLEIEPVA